MKLKLGPPSSYELEVRFSELSIPPEVPSLSLAPSRVLGHNIIEAIDIEFGEMEGEAHVDSEGSGESMKSRSYQNRGKKRRIGGGGIVVQPVLLVSSSPSSTMEKEHSFILHSLERLVLLKSLITFN